MRTCAWQRDACDDRAAAEREWTILTRAFMKKWSEVMEESLATKVNTRCSAATNVYGNSKTCTHDLWPVFFVSDVRTL